MSVCNVHTHKFLENVFLSCFVCSEIVYDDDDDDDDVVAAGGFSLVIVDIVCCFNSSVILSKFTRISLIKRNLIEDLWQK